MIIVWPIYGALFENISSSILKTGGDVSLIKSIRLTQTTYKNGLLEKSRFEFLADLKDRAQISQSEPELETFRIRFRVNSIRQSDL